MALGRKRGHCKMGEDIQYTVKSLEEVACVFETYASDQTAMQRFHQTQKAKEHCRIRAVVWRDAAEILRNLKITGDA